MISESHRVVRRLLLVATFSLIAATCSADDESSAPRPEIDVTTTTTTTTATTTTTTTTTTMAPDPVCDPARRAVAGPVEATLSHDGLERAYTVSLPPGYDGTTPAPMTLNLHGFGGSIEGQLENGLPEEAGRRGYIVVTPQGAPLSVPAGLTESEDAAEFDGFPFWNFFGSEGVDFGDGATGDFAGLASSALGTDDIGFFAALLDQMEADYCIDAARVYSTGMSNGAGMSTTLGCELGDRFAAIAPVSGVNLTGSCPGQDPVPVFAIHGDADVVATYAGETLMGFPLGNPSVPDRMVQWAERNACDDAPVVTADDPHPGIVSTVWANCVDGADVVLWIITGWGHSWPRAATPQDEGVIDAPMSIIDFFDAHRLSS